VEAKEILGRVELVSLPKAGINDVSARIDTGAKTSAIWATGVKIREDGRISFHIFGKKSPHYTGKPVVLPSYEETVVSSSIGHIQKRYKVKMTVRINGHKIKASFTLADRSKQVYPVLVGRNILRGKFIVDVTRGEPLIEEEKKRTKQLRKLLNVNKKD
jgi:hypothetical protein